MSMLGVISFFLIASSSDKEVKIVFVEGTIENGNIRAIRGRIVEETDTTITLERSNGRITIGRNFIIKIEDWKNNRSNRRNFNY